MKSAALLDLLGNENRRRILRLLARKPCYVTEISEYLGVSPKAVIDHLRKLEEAGLIESRVDDQRRKYFSISRNLRLEVRVSPYEFGAKSAYPASRSLDMNSCRYLSLEVSPSDTTRLPGLAAELRRLEGLENELSLAQRWVQGRLSEVRERIDDRCEETDGRLAADVLSALIDGPVDLERLSDRVEAPVPVVRNVIEVLADRGVVAREDGRWRFVD